MAGLSDIVRKAVAIADAVTLTLQATLTHEAIDGTYTRSGQPNYAGGVSRTAMVEKKQDQVRALDGTQQVSHTKITFLRQVAINVADRFTLPDGTKPKILALAQPIADDGTAFVSEVWF